MKITINLEKKHLILFSLFFIIIASYVAIADPAVWHSLSTLSRNESEWDPVDSDSNKKIDWADNATYAVNADFISGKSIADILSSQSGKVAAEKVNFKSGTVNYKYCAGWDPNCQAQAWSTLLDKNDGTGGRFNIRLFKLPYNYCFGQICIKTDKGEWCSKTADEAMGYLPWLYYNKTLQIRIQYYTGYGGGDPYKPLCGVVPWSYTYTE